MLVDIVPAGDSGASASASSTSVGSKRKPLDDTAIEAKAPRSDPTARDLRMDAAMAEMARNMQM
eukprot:7762095-Prorocentrum_lima.AAC.1